MVAEELFTGPQSLRVRGERFALIACTAMAPISVALIALIFPGVSMSEFVLLIAAGLVFVSISRGKLLGSSIRIEGRQFPELAELAQNVAADLGMTAPQVFVRDDPFVPIVAVGVGEPYALIISSQYYEHLRRDELRFLIARELGHIAAGHTRLTSLLSASGRENPVVALVFGAWLRRTEFTADRVGLLCGDIESARGAIAITTFHAIGRHVNLGVLAEQRDELTSDPSLRLGEWLAGAPYATNRLEALREFDRAPLALDWRQRLATQRGQPQIVVSALPPHRVVRKECASAVRRASAVLIDLAVLSAIVHSPIGKSMSKTVDAGRVHHDTPVPAFVLSHLPTIELGVGVVLSFLTYFVYGAILVSLVGQTLGMTVMDVRVVTNDYTKPGIVRALWRYVVAFTSVLTSLAFFTCFMRIQPHDRLSGTRLVGGRK